jgi:hypothetical protein
MIDCVCRMAQVFHPRANVISRILLFWAVFLVAGVLWLLGAFDRSSWVTRAGLVREQPVPFSHKLHVGGLGIDCRHCHTSVEESAFAGMPPTKTCMNCHSQIFPDAAVLEVVRASNVDDWSLEWTRVADLPDFVYFDHSIHVKKGVGCVTCHGRVDLMPLLWQAESMQMNWCLECHRHPERFVRPREAVFSMTWAPEEDQAELGLRLTEEYGIRRAIDCSVCHR